MRSGVVAIVGRPNVGKSSLFNRLLGKRKAIVESTPGVTRDRIYGKLYWRSKEIKLIDTGGIDLGSDNIKKKTLNQVKLALEEAEVILFVCDISSEITAFDREAADLVRKKNKKVVLAVNKADSEKIAQMKADFFQLGLGTPYPVSSLHGLGIGDLLDEVASLISQEKEEVLSGPKFAIVGKPNVGKSSFLNALLKEERVVVDARPGTTRDAVDKVMVKDGCEILLIDTAGIKHKSRLKENLEFYASLRSWDAVSRADICIMLIDAYQGMSSDDVRILNSVWDEGKPLVLAVNKWDLIGNVDTKKYKEMMEKRAHLTEEVPVCFISCLKRQNILEPINMAQDLYSRIDLKIPTHRLNEFLKKTLQKLPPPTVSGRRPNFLYIVQVKSGQPAFKVFVSDPKRIRESYSNYFKKCLRLEFGLEGIPVKLFFEGRKKKNSS